MKNGCGDLPPLKVSTVEHEGILHFSRWSEYHVQFTRDSLLAFFQACGVERLFILGQKVELDRASIAPAEYCDRYEAALVEKEPEGKLAVGMSEEPPTFYAQKLQDGSCIVRPKAPYVQLKACRYTVTAEGEISMEARRNEAVFWGITIQYPLLSMNANEGVTRNSLKEKGGVNSHLFSRIKNWMRNATKPTEIQVGGKAIKTILRSVR